MTLDNTTSHCCVLHGGPFDGIVTFVGSPRGTRPRELLLDDGRRTYRYALPAHQPTQLVLDGEYLQMHLVEQTANGEPEERLRVY